MSKSSASLILLISFLMLFSFVSALEPITVERQMAETAKAGETIQVTLNLKFIGETPSGVIVTEFVPEGWEITGSLPAFTEFEGKVSWLLYGDDVKNSSIVYELKVPENFKQPQLIEGSWETLTESELISGDAMLIPKTEAGDKDKEKDKTEPPADYTLFILAGIVIIILAVIVAVVVIKKKK